MIEDDVRCSLVDQSRIFVLDGMMEYFQWMVLNKEPKIRLVYTLLKRSQCWCVVGRLRLTSTVRHRGVKPQRPDISQLHPQWPKVWQIPHLRGQDNIVSGRDIQTLFRAHWQALEASSSLGFSLQQSHYHQQWEWKSWPYFLEVERRPRMPGGCCDEAWRG